MSQPNPRSFGQIKADFQALLNRDDITSNLTDQFVRDGLNRVIRDLRVPGFENEATLEAEADGSIEIPTNFIQLIDIEDVTDEQIEHKFVEKTKFRALKRSAGTYTKTRFYTRKRDRWVFYPALTEGTEVVVFYYSDPATLEDDDDSIPLFYFAPEVVKYAALSYATDYFDDDRYQRFENRYLSLVSDLNEQAVMQEMANINQSIHQDIVDEEY